VAPNRADTAAAGWAAVAESAARDLEEAWEAAEEAEEGEGWAAGPAAAAAGSETEEEAGC
jgi:hypothetical protein